MTLSIIWIFAAASPQDSPLTWLTSLGAFLPAAAILWYHGADARKERDKYRDILFEMLPEYRDAMQKAALAQEQLATVVEARLLSEAEMVKMRRLLERLSRRDMDRRGAGG